MNFKPVMIMTVDKRGGLRKHSAHTVAYSISKSKRYLCW